MIDPQALCDKFKYALDDHWGYIWGKAGEMWTEAKQAAMNKTTSDKYASARKYGEKWVGHRVADCSGLFTWGFRELGGYMYHGSNTIWRSYCVEKGKLGKGKRTDGVELQKGTAVFTGTDDDHPHIGLYVGNGIVIEAAGTFSGVISTKITNTKWKYWGELKGVSYAAPSRPTVYPRTIRKGDSGEEVKRCQEILMRDGYALPKYGADGKFGNETRKAVKAFQKDHNLVADGIVGPLTWEKLLEGGN